MHFAKASPMSQRSLSTIEGSHSSAITEIKGTSFSSLLIIILLILENATLSNFPSLNFTEEIMIVIKLLSNDVIFTHDTNFLMDACYYAETCG